MSRADVQLAPRSVSVRLEMAGIAEAHAIVCDVSGIMQPWIDPDWYLNFFRWNGWEVETVASPRVVYQPRNIFRAEA